MPTIHGDAVYGTVDQDRHPRIVDQLLPEEPREVLLRQPVREESLDRQKIRGLRTETCPIGVDVLRIDRQVTIDLAVPRGDVLVGERPLREIGRVELCELAAPDDAGAAEPE
ncbi:MAG: hypothetical protein JSV48_03180, partial [Bradyrhizobium sp.]